MTVAMQPRCRPDRGSTDQTAILMIEGRVPTPLSQPRPLMMVATFGIQSGGGHAGEGGVRASWQDGMVWDAAYLWALFRDCEVEGLLDHTRTLITAFFPFRRSSLQCDRGRSSGSPGAPCFTPGSDSVLMPGLC